MNCIVVDDNKLARAAMVHLIAQVDFLQLKKECENPVDAFNYLQQSPVDLLFLDVEMPGMNGVELVRNLKTRPIVVFITAKKDYAAEAFELNVADYIVKPVTLPRFMSAVSRAKELFDMRDDKTEVAAKNPEYIFVRHKSVITKIKISDILFIQALGDYVTIFTPAERFTIHLTLGGIEQKLSPEKFYRVHRSFIVALDHIDNIEEGTAFIQKHPVPVAEQFRQSLLKRLNFI